MSPSEYQNIVSGVRTFLIGRSDRYKPGDTVVLHEFSERRTGRQAVCQITHTYAGQHVIGDGLCVMSFQLVFPESEPRIPVKVFMELHKLLRDTQKALSPTVRKI